MAAAVREMFDAVEKRGVLHILVPALENIWVCKSILRVFKLAHRLVPAGRSCKDHETMPENCPYMGNGIVGREAKHSRKVRLDFQ